MALPTSSPPIAPNDKEKDKKKKEKEPPSSLSSTFKRTKQSKSATALTSSATRPDNGLFTLRYEDATAAKPPIPVILPPRRNPPSEQHPALRDRLSSTTGTSAGDDWKRDSGLAPTASTQATEGSFIDSIVEEKEQENPLGWDIDFDLHKSIAPLNPAPMPAPHVDEALKKSDTRTSNVGSTRWKLPGRKSSGAPRSPTDSAIDEDFSPIMTPIPTETFIQEEEINTMQFSKRGSLMWGGAKGMNGFTRPNPTRRQPSFSMLASTKPNMLTKELEKESQKVRSMYEQYVDDGRYSSLAQRAEGGAPAVHQDTLDLLAPPQIPFDRPGTNMSVRTEHELAGGIEDWEDVEVEDVNRYGFIESRRKSDRPGTAEPRPVQRVSTVLELASSAPRRKRTFGRAASSTASTKKGAGRAARSFSQGSNSSQRSNGRIRSVSNRLPGNRDRRFVDEAGDMLTLPPGLADIAEEEEGGKASKALKRKEIERGEKWQKMAKIIKKGEDGKGMEFEFDPKNPKVIERTWKGIPDRWRGAAWYSFLAASAKKRDDTVPDADVIKFFHKLQDQSSADDVQIDLDVPRTISQHIMFRTRYRGGQRLLFRVLHAVSLYFPDTGYVQGMASLAATLLCYYDEERAFVMLVRMFTLRSLGKLYESGFGGLMAALEEFKVKWLASGDVSKKLDELNIEPTSWGTRWYLTLFNLSIPFAAQLRVWDVFMLLGDIDPLLPSTPERPFQGGLDVLHAASAALIAATREILMDSDFENAMKVLTSFVPIKDEELLMKVTRAEWKVHRGKHRV